MFFGNSAQLNLVKQIFAFGVLRVSESQTFVKDAYALQSCSVLDKSPPSKCKTVNLKTKMPAHKYWILMFRRCRKSALLERNIQ